MNNELYLHVEIIIFLCYNVKQNEEKKASIEFEKVERHSMFAEEKQQRKFGDRFWGLEDRSVIKDRQIREHAKAEKLKEDKIVEHARIERLQAQKKMEEEELMKKVSERESNDMIQEEAAQRSHGDTFWGVDKAKRIQEMGKNISQDWKKEKHEKYKAANRLMRKKLVERKENKALLSKTRDVSDNFGVNNTVTEIESKGDDEKIPFIDSSFDESFGNVNNADGSEMENIPTSS